MKEPNISKVLRILLKIMVVGGGLMVITMPTMFDFYVRVTHDVYTVVPEYRNFIVPFLMLSGSAVLWVVAELLKMLNSIPSDPFEERNVRALIRIGLAFIILSGMFFVKCFFYITVLTLVCAILFVFVLADLFRQAVAFKEENDLTI